MESTLVPHHHILVLQPSCNWLHNHSNKLKATEQYFPHTLIGIAMLVNHITVGCKVCVCVCKTERERERSGTILEHKRVYSINHAVMLWGMALIEKMIVLRSRLVFSWEIMYCMHEGKCISLLFQNVLRGIFCCMWRKSWCHRDTSAFGKWMIVCEDQWRGYTCKLSCVHIIQMMSSCAPSTHTLPSCISLTHSSPLPIIPLSYGNTVKGPVCPEWARESERGE